MLEALDEERDMEGLELTLALQLSSGEERW